jgi:putative membrane protein
MSRAPAHGPTEAASASDKVGRPQTEYCVSNGLFHAKLGLFVVVLVLEVWPMATLMRWRSARWAGRTPDTSGARALAAVSHAQAGIIVIIVLLATAIARGL